MEKKIHSTNPKFIADEMNGDLARWLRIMGYDCLYLTGEGNMDVRIIDEAKRRKRIVLTSDRDLFRKCLGEGVEAVYTSGGSREDRLANLIERLRLDASLGRRPLRCSLCNARLKKVGREEVSSKLPRELIERHGEFWTCPRCGKIYWEGSHWEEITKTIERARLKAEERP
ncbi:MAG: Mut7-C RNAse domain-containing protein [Candidatus Bathyarchaeia archaeon]